MQKVSIFWFRRDLRTFDNTALNNALNGPFPVLPVFIFDTRILDELPKNDPRVQFIHETLSGINEVLKNHHSGIRIFHSTPLKAFEKIRDEFDIQAVFFNKDYEPYARERDKEVYEYLRSNGIPIKAFKDQVIFERNEILKKDGKPYTVFTPYKKKWLEAFEKLDLGQIISAPSFDNFLSVSNEFPSLEDLGFRKSNRRVKPYRLDNLKDYDQTRNFPALDKGSYLSPHLRFGTLSIRELVNKVHTINPVFLSELIWREFFMQIIFHFPKVVDHNFKRKYDEIKWRNDKEAFDQWCKGKTGYPLVDAGMRELNESGYMHNRVRMVCASFLCKHLLIDWRWGEAYFAEKLLDYELSSNNGNWQWAAGTGCDAAPYFRVFNPYTQQEKFDKKYVYVKKWVPEYGTDAYPDPMVDHKIARERAIRTYKEGLDKNK
jgi:deoxyribodipyrimidine photo-lyase